MHPHHFPGILVSAWVLWELQGHDLFHHRLGGRIREARERPCLASVTPRHPPARARCPPLPRRPMPSERPACEVCRTFPISLTHTHARGHTRLGPLCKVPFNRGRKKQRRHYQPHLFETKHPQKSAPCARPSLRRGRSRPVASLETQSRRHSTHTMGELHKTDSQ